MDPKQIVASGYDQIAERYAQWATGVRVEERERYTSLSLGQLRPGSDVLELGCGSGEPTTKRLAERFRVTGVDISERQIALARQNVPEATFVQADMTQLELPPESFDAVTASYSITHVPRDEHADLFRKINVWVRPGGLFVGALRATATPVAIEDDWLGAPMYFSHFDSETNRALIEQAGFRILRATEETADEDGARVTFLWVVAQRALDATSPSP